MCLMDFHGVSINFYPFSRWMWHQLGSFHVFCHKSCHLSSFLRSSKTPEIVATFGWVKKLPFESQLIWTAGTYTDWF